MSTYQFEADDGTRIEREYPIGSAPCIGHALVVDGKLYLRCYSDTAPVYVPPMATGRTRSRSHQLPRWYGFNQSPGLQARLGRRPTARESWAEGRKNAVKAGKLDEFDSAGRPVAADMRGVYKHMGRGKDQGDVIAWD